MMFESRSSGFKAYTAFASDVAECRTEIIICAKQLPELPAATGGVAAAAATGAAGTGAAGVGLAGTGAAAGSLAALCLLRQAFLFWLRLEPGLASWCLGCLA